jgi:hypothetical protein
MNPEKIDSRQAPIPFEAWKLKLQEDCEHQGRLLVFNAFNDSVLKLFWERGLDPTVEALANNKTKSD